MISDWLLGCTTRDRCPDRRNTLQYSRDRYVACSMTFRIKTAELGRFTVFILSGRIEQQAIAGLRRLFELQTDHHDIILDLKDVGVIDRDAVKFLRDCEADAMKLENCPAYVREWMEREKT